jgi:L-threonylcarbamoyladenylate synthase
MEDYKIYLTEGSKLEYFKVDAKNPKTNALNRAADLIKAGGVIVYPTDTLYGFGVNIKNSMAMDKLYELKGRELHKPISLMINTKSQAEALIGQLNPEESRIFDTLLPGKITLLLRKKKNIELAELKGWDKIGFRIPNTKLCHNLVAQVGGPISSTSANFTNQENITTVEQIIDLFGRKIDLILDSGPIDSTKGSSILDTSTSPPTLIREGDISKSEIEERLGHEIYSDYPRKFVVTFVCTGNICRSPMAEGILKRLISRTKFKDFVDINSAGTLNLGESPAALEAIDVSQDYDIDISEHSSTHIRRDMVRRAHLVICLALNHYNYLTRRYPEFKNKIILLKQWQVKQKLGNPSVADPIGHNIEFFNRTFKEISNEISRIFPEIIKNVKAFIQEFNLEA